MNITIMNDTLQTVTRYICVVPEFLACDVIIACQTITWFLPQSR